MRLLLFPLLADAVFVLDEPIRVPAYPLVSQCPLDWHHHVSTNRCYRFFLEHPRHTRRTMSVDRGAAVQGAAVQGAAVQGAAVHDGTRDGAERDLSKETAERDGAERDLFTAQVDSRDLSKETAAAGVQGAAGVHGTRDGAPAVQTSIHGTRAAVQGAAPVERSGGPEPEEHGGEEVLLPTWDAGGGGSGRRSLR